MFDIKKSQFKTNKMPQILTLKVDAVPSNGHFNYDNFKIERHFLMYFKSFAHLRLARESGKGCY